MPQLIASTTPTPIGYLQLKTGKFGLPDNPYDQIVFHQSSTSGNARFFSIVSADPTSLVLTAGHPMLPYYQYPCAAGIQVGNFDHRDPDPSTPGATTPNPNDQIALLYCTGGSGNNQGYDLNIYSVVPATYNITGESQTVPPALGWGVIRYIRYTRPLFSSWRANHFRVGQQFEAVRDHRCASHAC